MKYIFSKGDANHFKKAGVEMWVYMNKNDCEEAGFVYQEVDGIHESEFINEKSTFLYYIIEGEGVFVIEGKEYSVKATDVIAIPPKTKFYYKGKMKQILNTVPAWQEKYEKIIRKIE